MPTLLGFDFGLKRIGVAVGETETAQAHPLETIHDEANANRFARIQKLIGEWGPTGFVVGLPLNEDGSEHEMTARARRFANQLRGRYGLPVFLVDERYTSSAAEEELRTRGMNWQTRKQHIDALAAQLILQAYLDQHGQRSNP